MYDALIPGCCSPTFYFKKIVFYLSLKHLQEADEVQRLKITVLFQFKCAGNLSEHKVVFFLSSTKHCTVTLFTYSLYYSALFIFSLSVACVVRSMQCSLSLLHGEGPFLSPCASETNLASSDRYMAAISYVFGWFWGKEGAFVMKLVIEEDWESGCQSAL